MHLPCHVCGVLTPASVVRISTFQEDAFWGKRWVLGSGLLYYCLYWNTRYHVYVFSSLRACVEGQCCTMIVFCTVLYGWVIILTTVCGLLDYDEILRASCG